MSYLLVAIVDCAFHGLDLIKHLDTFSLVILDSSLNLFKLSTQIVNNFVLVTKAVFVVSLARTNLIFKASYLSLQICNDFLKDLEVTLSCLVVLNFLTVGVNDAISSVIS